MLNRIPHCLFVLAAALVLSGPSEAAARSGDTSTATLPSILFDGYMIDETLVQSIAETRIRSWQDCSATPLEAYVFDLPQSGACLAITVGTEALSTTYVVSDERCFDASSATCYGGYRLFGLMETDIDVQPGSIHMTVDSFATAKTWRGHRLRYAGRFLSWFEFPGLSHEYGWRAYDRFGTVTGGDTVVALPGANTCGEEDARDADDCKRVGDCYQDLCESDVDTLSSLFGTGQAMGTAGACMMVGAVLIETGPGALVAVAGCAAVGTMVGGGSAAASEYGLTHLMDCGAEGLRAENACEDRIGSNEGDLGGERDDEDDDNPTDIDTDQPGL